MISHEKIEKNVILMLVLILITVSVGGLVEIVPLYTIESPIEPVRGVRPYSPLELVGRNIYVREGCYTCHSQMIRPFRDEVERYGHYSLAAESIYDHPFQWGSKRTGPDLARVGNKYSDDWHRDHLSQPKSVVPGTVMPAYPWLARTELDRQRHEIEGCGRRIADELGIRMRYFAYPVGLPESFDFVAKRMLSEAGVRLAFSLYGGYRRRGHRDPYDVPRASVSISMSDADFRAMLIAPGLFARW